MNLKINKLRTLAKLLDSNASHAMLFFVTDFRRHYRLIVQSKLRITPAPSNLTKYAQKTLRTKTPLSRGVTGKTFTDTEKNTKNKKTEIYPFSDWDCHRQPSNKEKNVGFTMLVVGLFGKRQKRAHLFLHFLPKYSFFRN